MKLLAGTRACRRWEYPRISQTDSGINTCEKTTRKARICAANLLGAEAQRRERIRAKGKEGDEKEIWRRSSGLEASKKRIREGNQQDGKKRRRTTIKYVTAE